jgi:excisionase family DNA binding protein
MSDVTLMPVYVSPAQAAKVLGLSRSEVYKLLDRGLLAGCRHGRRRLVVWSSVQDFADKVLAS